MNKQQQLDQISDRIIQDNICPELAENATQLVFGDGNPDSEVVFIGEAPGKTEDEQGKPFVGAAGKFLDEMLHSIELERQDVYITNIVKYRPPENRDPRPEEIAAFMPYLLQQVSVIEPKLIATLGRFSTNVFLPKLRISQVHGQPKRINVAASSLEASLGTGRQQVAGKENADSQKWVILPLYHPAAALYNGGQRQMLLDDFAKIPKILELIEGEKATTHE